MRLSATAVEMTGLWGAEEDRQRQTQIPYGDDNKKKRQR